MVSFIILEFALVLLMNPLYAGEVILRSPEAAVTLPVTSFQERSFLKTIKQQYDFSCGSAALATLLTHHYEHPISERDVFMAMYNSGNKQKIKKEGFSLLDMKNYLESNGYRADGFRLPLEKLSGIGVPAIALINNDGYNHFVVIKGINDQYILIGDPSRGTKLVPRTQFKNIWNGIVFLVRSKRNIATKHFNDHEEWYAAAAAPLDMAVDRNMLADMTLFFRGSNDF